MEVTKVCFVTPRAVRLRHPASVAIVAEFPPRGRAVVNGMASLPTIEAGAGRWIHGRIGRNRYQWSVIEPPGGPTEVPSPIYVIFYNPIPDPGGESSWRPLGGSDGFLVGLRWLRFWFRGPGCPSFPCTDAIVRSFFLFLLLNC